MNNSLDPNEPLLVSLPAKQWNAVLTMMNEGIAAAAAILADIQRQCMQQQRPTWQPPARGNGATQSGSEAHEGDLAS